MSAMSTMTDLRSAIYGKAGLTLDDYFHEIWKVISDVDASIPRGVDCVRTAVVRDMLTRLIELVEQCTLGDALADNPYRIGDKVWFPHGVGTVAAVGPRLLLVKLLHDDVHVQVPIYDVHPAPADWRELMAAIEEAMGDKDPWHEYLMTLLASWSCGPEGEDYDA